MDITRRRLAGFLAASTLLSVLPAHLLAAEPGLFIFGRLPPPSRIHTVLSAGAPGDPLLLALAAEKLVGLSFYQLAQPGNEFLPEKMRRLPKTGRLAGRASTLSLERVMAIAPDVIIDCGMTDATYLSLAGRVSAQTGIPWVLVEGGLASTPRQLRQLGALLGVADRAERQARLAERFLNEAADFAARQTVRRTFYSARGLKGQETGLEGSLHTAAAEFLGLENVAKQVGQSRLAQVSMEQLLDWQPELVITQSRPAWQHITRDPLWQQISAVQHQQVLLLPHHPFGWLDAPPGVNRLMGLRRLHAHFDPQIKARLAGDLALFFRVFWQSEPQSSQWQQWLNTV
ncbi:ABC transporter substrate-binding protein [Erwinia mallotivora]|uniref:ABC transporter ATP-binding protein n=1 Tax=Erwinia mallotivora TaxID=69222 RepID=A0A014Q1E1_9GAMM|nr:ABC transporter substrate-binding protein [Erwinia mallotivora]EXU77002.1 ABC transporter ATP-binding protein [Erwinia mallotivora]